MKIALLIGNEEKTFTNDFVKARIFRNALKINQELKKKPDISADLFDSLVEFVVTAFEKQFTVDQFWDGIEAKYLQAEVMRIFNEVLSFGGFEVQRGNDQGK